MNLRPFNWYYWRHCLGSLPSGSPCTKLSGFAKTLQMPKLSAFGDVATVRLCRCVLCCIFTVYVGLVACLTVSPARPLLHMARPLWWCMCGRTHECMLWNEWRTAHRAFIVGRHWGCGCGWSIRNDANENWFPNIYSYAWCCCWL